MLFADMYGNPHMSTLYRSLQLTTRLTVYIQNVRTNPYLSSSNTASLCSGTYSCPTDVYSTSFSPALMGVTVTARNASPKQPAAIKKGIPIHASPVRMPQRNTAANTGSPVIMPVYVSTEMTVYSVPRCFCSTMPVTRLRVGTANA